MAGKTVYMVMTTEVIHHAHMEIIAKAAALGELVVGVYSDAALVQLERTPLMRQTDRMTVYEGLKGVSRVVLQEEVDYERNLRALRPDYVVHGDNWRDEGMKLERVRERALQVLSEWGGELVEYPYTHGVEIEALYDNTARQSFLPEIRRRKLNYLLQSKGIVRIMEAHNGITGLIVEKAQVRTGGGVREFDGIWVSSLCDSTAKGKPDI